jgi:transcriptional regulator with XRE-family HTH domain
MSRGAELMRMYRRAMHLTQAGMGALLGDRPWRREQVSLWETGRVVPRHGSRQRLASVSRGLIGVAAWDEPPEALQPGGQTSIMDLLGAAGGGQKACSALRSSCGGSLR